MLTDTYQRDHKAAKAAGKYPTGWPELQVPDGRVVTQSAAMARYAGKLGSLYPTDPIEALICDEAINLCLDALGKCPGDPDPEIKKKVTGLRARM